MVFVVLNGLAVLAFAAITYLVDRNVKVDNKEGNPLTVPLLVATVEAIMLFLVMIFRRIWLDSFTGQLMRIVFCLDGMFFVSFSFGILGIITRIKRNFIRILKFLLVAFAIFIVYFRFESVDISGDYNIVIGSDYLFSEASGANVYFPWTWVTLFNAIYKGILPVVCFIFLTLLQEKNGNQLQRYQGLVIGEGIVMMWVLTLFFNYMAEITPAFTSLFMYTYLAMFMLVLTAVTRTTIPSGKSVLVSIFKFFVSYVIPGAAIGALVLFIQPIGKVNQVGFIIEFSLSAAAAIVIAIKISQLLSSSTKLYSADYGPALERDLATIDYSGEMDQITNRMYEIFRKNVESSSVNVYVLNNTGALETAYSSNNLKMTLPVNTVMFETLLNENKSVVCFSEIGNKHVISNIEKELTDFFEKTKADALFVLNEGHNILGLITLGKKISGDHYKEYDYNTFVKLYSYFFVFGYYMRNISNKDIISVVNREIRMSSQIITSIQENIDHVKNPKIDTGYLMVPAHNIGGEFIDMIRLTESRHLFVVGDMSGKGIAASMNMVILKSIIRTYLAEIHDFKELVVKINSFIRESFIKGTIFAGLFALIDFEKDTMYYINCGIPALMLYTQVYNNVIEIQGSGHILGFVKDISPYISVKTTKLSRGDIILACTDGLVQSHSLRGEQFGKERIQQCVLDNSTYPAQRMAQFTFDSLTKFMSKEMEDDVSILVLKYESSVQFVEEEEKAKQEAAVEAEPTASIDIPENAEVVNVEESIAAAAEANAPVENIAEESVTANVVTENVAEAPLAEEAPVTEAEMTSSPEEKTEESPAPEAASDNPFDDPDIPDLSNLDEMLKMAGL